MVLLCPRTGWGRLLGRRLRGRRLPGVATDPLALLGGEGQGPADELRGLALGCGVLPGGARCAVTRSFARGPGAGLGWGWEGGSAHGCGAAGPPLFVGRLEHFRVRLCGEGAVHLAWGDT